LQENICSEDHGLYLQLCNNPYLQHLKYNIKLNALAHDENKRDFSGGGTVRPEITKGNWVKDVRFVSFLIVINGALGTLSDNRGSGFAFSL
jgi:hypothetical protein